MATLFTRIINGELPGRFVYTDDLVVARRIGAAARPASDTELDIAAEKLRAALGGV